MIYDKIRDRVIISREEIDNVERITKALKEGKTLVNENRDIAIRLVDGFICKFYSNFKPDISCDILTDDNWEIIEDRIIPKNMSKNILYACNECRYEEQSIKEYPCSECYIGKHNDYKATYYDEAFCIIENEVHKYKCSDGSLAISWGIELNNRYVCICDDGMIFFVDKNGRNCDDNSIDIVSKIDD
jgi:hypothetical protein